jgi:hypothetical protein
MHTSEDVLELELMKRRRQSLLAVTVRKQPSRDSSANSIASPATPLLDRLCRIACSGTRIPSVSTFQLCSGTIRAEQDPLLLNRDAAFQL